MDRDWSLTLVEERLVAAFREMQGRAVFSPCPSVILPMPGRRLEGLELIALCQTVLGRQSRESKALLTWARAQAGGPSLSDVCEEFGWNRSTIEAARRRGAARVCDEISKSALPKVA
jgi:hypothetical protein